MHHIISSEAIIPVNSQKTVLYKHSLVLSGGTIIDILPTEDASRKYPNAQQKNYEHHTLLPGFINTHTHTPMVLLRGLGDALPLNDWLKQCIWPAEKSLMSQQFIADGMELGIAEMLLNGTTCFSEHYFMPEIAAATASEHGIRAAIGICILDQISDNDALFKQAPDLIKGSSSMLSYTYAPHSPYMVSDASFKSLLACYEQAPAPIHVHLHESEREIKQSLEQYNKTPIARLNELGIMDQQVIAVHMVHTNEDDLKILKQKPCHIVTCPDSNLKLASGFCNINNYKKIGLNVALGTDGAASNNDLDILSEARNASLINKALNRNACLSSAHSVLEMLTINGAKALGLEQDTGSLEIGKAADFIAWDNNHINNYPQHDLAAQIIFAGNCSQISDVWVNGSCLVKDRKLTKMDMDKLLNKAKYWQEKTRAFN